MVALKSQFHLLPLLLYEKIIIKRGQNLFFFFTKLYSQVSKLKGRGGGRTEKSDISGIIIIFYAQRTPSLLIPTFFLSLLHNK